MSRNLSSPGEDVESGGLSIQPDSGGRGEERLEVTNEVSAGH